MLVSQYHINLHGIRASIMWNCQKLGFPLVSVVFLPSSSHVFCNFAVGGFLILSEDSTESLQMTVSQITSPPQIVLVVLNGNLKRMKSFCHSSSWCHQVGTGGGKDIHVHQCNYLANRMVIFHWLKGASQF